MFAWQGWKISLPPGWNPMKLEGNFEEGYALIADVQGPRLGIRWTTPGRNFDVDAWARKVLVDEVGQLAADEAIACGTECWQGTMLYTEPDPPGRDVWVARSKRSGRTIELVHHVDRGDRSKMPDLRQNLTDSQLDDELRWAAFDLSCKTPADWRLDKMLLNAGDLKLAFTNQSRRRSVRQIAVAHLALKRMPLDQWLDRQQEDHRKHYRSDGPARKVVIAPNKLEGIGSRLARRGGFWRRTFPAEIHLLALQDTQRDRLLLLEAENQRSAEELARTVGWADECGR